LSQFDLFVRFVVEIWTFSLFPAYFTAETHFRQGEAAEKTTGKRPLRQVQTARPSGCTAGEAADAIRRFGKGFGTLFCVSAIGAKPIILKTFAPEIDRRASQP
jgi:hypothetical protein